MPHILPTSANETIGEETGDFYPVFYNAFARPLSQWKCYKMIYGTQTGGDDLLLRVWSIRCSLFYYQWLEAGYFVFMA